MSDFLQHHGMQHARFLCLPLSPRLCSNSCPLSLWCYLTILSSAIPFPFCLQSFLASGSFLSQLFTSGGQSIRASAWASVFPMNIQGLFPLALTDLISLLFKGLKILLQNHNLKASVIWSSAYFMVQFSYPYMTTGKTIALPIWAFVSKVMSLLFNTLSRFVLAFLLIWSCWYFSRQLEIYLSWRFAWCTLHVS